MVGKVFWLGAVGRDRRAERLGDRGAVARAGTEGVRAPRAAWVGGRRDRVRVPPRARPRRRLRPDPAGPAARMSTCGRQSGSSRSPQSARRTAPRCSRTTTSRRSSTAAPPGVDVSTSCEGRAQHSWPPATGRRALGALDVGADALPARSLARRLRGRRSAPAVSDREDAPRSRRGEGEDELERAALALRDVDPAAAAEAEILLGEAVWQRGDRDGRHRTSSVPLPLWRRFRCRARRRSSWARWRGFSLSPAGRGDALELVERAIEMANDLGDDALLGDALNTRGIARCEPRRSRRDRRSRAQPRAHSRGRPEPGSARLHQSRLDALRRGRRGEPSVGSDHSRRAALRRALSLGLALRWFRGNLADSTFHLVGSGTRRSSWPSAEIDDPEPHYMQRSLSDVTGP